jgi:hypothetical protein
MAIDKAKWIDATSKTWILRSAAMSDLISHHMCVIRFNSVAPKTNR